MKKKILLIPLIVFSLSLFISGCGKKAPPSPPDEIFMERAAPR